jgi:hypothetical protein
VADSSLADRTTVQLIWSSPPDSIGLELPGDLERLAERAFAARPLPASR